MLRRLFIVMAACVLVLSLAGCGFDSLEAQLVWSGGDLDLVIEDPDGTRYIADDGLLTPNGYFDQDALNGGSETFKSYPLFHRSGEYWIGVGNNESYDISFDLYVTRNGVTTHYADTCTAGMLGWADPVNIRQARPNEALTSKKANR